MGNKKSEKTAENQKQGFLDGIDVKAESKGKGMTTLWQIVKYLFVSIGVFLIQLILANLLPLIFDSVTAVLPEFLQSIFNPDSLFDVTKQSGLVQYNKYVIDGVVTWGYVLPFFLSNALANIVGYFVNKEKTFKSDAPKYCFVIYFVLIVLLILFSTWLQGVIYGAMSNVDNAFVSGIARTVAAMGCGAVQMLVLFPMEKFVLFKKKKEVK